MEYLFSRVLEERDSEFPDEVRRLVGEGYTFFVNHSGGKDSSAQLHFIRRHVPDDQILIVHAILPEVEWHGVEDYVRENTFGLPVHTCKSRRTLIQMIEERGMFPSPSMRQCTSDLKRGPIERTIRQLGIKKIVNCMGMRAQESSSRSKLTTFKFNEKNSKAGRDWFDWLPIHSWQIEEVYDLIDYVGHKPHWAYGTRERPLMSRLSCCFCIMSNQADLTTAARLNPPLYKRYVDLELKTEQVMLMPSKTHGKRSLEQVTGVKVYSDEERPVVAEMLRTAYLEAHPKKDEADAECLGEQLVLI